VGELCVAAAVGGARDSQWWRHSSCCCIQMSSSIASTLHALQFVFLFCCHWCSY